jgi:hypothetical protein
MESNGIGSAQNQILRNFAIPVILGIVADQQRTYRINPITVNGKKVVQVVIDSHYKKKHSESMNDLLILKLVSELDGRRELPESKKGPYSYFATLIEHRGKQYRLIWLLEDHAIYIGVVNAYRDKRRRS